jgi:hypothetical protein
VVALEDISHSLDDEAVAFVALGLELAYSDVISVDWCAVSAPWDLRGFDCDDLMHLLSALQN